MSKRDKEGNVYKEITTEYLDPTGNKITSIKTIAKNGLIEEHFEDNKGNKINSGNIQCLPNQTTAEIIYKNEHQNSSKFFKIEQILA